MKMTIRNLVIILGVVVFLFGAVSSTLLLLDSPVEAYSCQGSCNLPPGGCKCKKYKNGKCVSYENCGNNSCGVKMSNGEHSCNHGQTAACTCVGSNCKKSGGQSCSNLGSVCSCSCSPVSCPPGGTPNKFMTKPKTTAYGVRCGSGGCDGTSYACDPQYVNAPPSCSVLPSSISMTREDVARQVQLTASDPDYGDTVQITKVRVVDTAGNLKSCVKVSTLDGGIVENLTVRTGSDNPAVTSQLTNLLVDPREAHGIFDNVNGQSVCSGYLEVEIRDLDSDQAGPDVSDVTSCRINISVTNQAPQLSDVTILDRDPVTALREKSGTGNLVDGRAALYVGSPLTTSTKSRAATCNTALSTTDPVRCPEGNETFLATRRNPIHLEFTVTDANGANDIAQAGVWIQRQAQDPGAIALPLAAGGVRNSFQALYSEKEPTQFTGDTSNWYFLSRECLGGSCGPQSIDGSSKQIFSALTLIPNRGIYNPLGNGNVSNSPYAWSSPRAWHGSGFPDCMNTIAGCRSGNVPTASKSEATADASTLANYDWSIAADDTHMICYESGSLTPSVVAAASTCPSNCAACAKKEGVVSAGANALKFKFTLFFNDKDGSDGLTEGKYSVFVSALDKVGVPLGNVTGRGAFGWVKFDKNGNLCSGATCGGVGDFVLNYDPVAPTVTDVTWQTVGTTDVNATLKLSDNSGGSGIAGVTSRFIGQQQYLDGEPLGDRTWAKKADGTDFDGSNDHVVTSGPQIQMSATGLQAGQDLVVGACVYDRAGNMGCGRNNDGYVFLSPWVKTSLGDIFSAKGGSAAYVQSMPDKDDKTANSGLYDQFTQQTDTAGTGLLATGAGRFGLGGGYKLGSTNYQLGFTSNTTNFYRTTDTSSLFNITGLIPSTQDNEYERIRAAALYNCDLLNSSAPGTCQSFSSADSVSGDANYKIVTVGTATVGDLTCNKVNAIFVTGTLTINGQVRKSNATSACLFVVANGAKLVLDDTPSDVRNYPSPAPSPAVGDPSSDSFEAGVIASTGGTVQFSKGNRGVNTKSTDRLVIRGFVYSGSNVPLFKRVLAPVDNKRYPSEWIIYDSTLLDNLRPLLGAERTVDLTCGTSSHILCTTAR